MVIGTERKRHDSVNVSDSPLQFLSDTAITSTFCSVSHVDALNVNDASATVGMLVSSFATVGTVAEAAHYREVMARAAVLSQIEDLPSDMRAFHSRSHSLAGSH